MIIGAIIACVLLLVTTIFLWKTSIAGIELYTIIENADEDTKKLTKISNLSLFISICSVLYLGIWILISFVL